MPIKLHIDASWPSDDSITADRVWKWCYYDIGVIGLGEVDCGIKVGDQVTRSLDAERIRDWRLKSEHRESADRRKHGLPHCLAGGRGDVDHSRLGFGPGKRRDKSVTEAVELFWRNINMRRVILRPNRQR